MLRCAQLFDAKPAIMRAYQAAKGIGRARSKLSDDYVERAEFRLLLVWLQKYFELFQLFRQLDRSHDQRVSLAEFKAAIPAMQAWGLDLGSRRPEAVFAEVDTNGGGMLLFDEFARWALDERIGAEVDTEQW